MKKYFIILFIFLSSIFFIQKSKALDFELDSLGWSCDVDYGCGNGDHEIAESTNFIHYSAWKCLESEDPTICSTAYPLTLKIKLGDIWYNASSSSPIKIVSGGNPQNKLPQLTTCDYLVTPRATWTLQAKTGTACNTYEMYVENWQSINQDFFTVTVTGDCEQEQDYTNTLLLFCWILGTILAILISGLFKIKKRVKI